MNFNYCVFSLAVPLSMLIEGTNVFTAITVIYALISYSHAFVEQAFMDSAILKNAPTYSIGHVSVLTTSDLIDILNFLCHAYIIVFDSILVLQFNWLLGEENDVTVLDTLKHV